MKYGIELTGVTWELFKREMNWTDESVDQFATHQISIQHQVKVYEALGLDISKDNPTFEVLGNTGSVAAAIRLQLGLLTRSDIHAVYLASTRLSSGLVARRKGILRTHHAISYVKRSYT